MKKYEKKGFTLIELISVLVIMAIIALIATPLVMSIIRKSRVSADKRSIDAYGRSIELAIAGYLLDNGKFPTEVSQLTIEYSGNEVVCETTRINPDTSVYLAGCTVGGRSVEYTYGTDKMPTYAAYQVGDTVTYNEVDYYVIKDSATTEDSVTLLKAEPLSADEIYTYSKGSGAEGKTNGNGGMGYGITSDYSTSYVKKVVDAWKESKALVATDARLITGDEYEAMTMVETYETPSQQVQRAVPMYDWQYNNNYWYWTNTPYHDSSSDILVVGINGDLNIKSVNYDVFDSIGGFVRPVIVLPKSAL